MKKEKTKLSEKDVRTRKIIAMVVTGGILAALVGVLILVQYLCQKYMSQTWLDDNKKMLPLTIIPMLVCLIGTIVTKCTDVKYDNPIAGIVVYSILSAIGGVFSGMFMAWLCNRIRVDSVAHVFFGDYRYAIYFAVAPLICFMAAGYYALLTIRGSHYNSIIASYAFAALTLTLAFAIFVLVVGLKSEWQDQSLYIAAIAGSIIWLAMGVLSIQSHANPNAYEWSHIIVVAMETVALTCSVIVLVIMIIAMAILLALGSGNTHHVKAGDTIVIH